MSDVGCEVTVSNFCPHLVDVGQLRQREFPLRQVNDDLVSVVIDTFYLRSGIQLLKTLLVLIPERSKEC